MNYVALLPALLMVLFGCATLIVDVLPGSRHARRTWLVWFNGGGQILIAFSFWRQWTALEQAGPILALENAVTIDGLSLFVNALVWAAVVVLLLISYRYLEILNENQSEYYALALFAQCGMYFMASGTDLISIFLGVELTAISFYILVGFTRADRRANEAALKYLLLGAVSSGFLLYGFSLLYGVSGSTALREMTAIAGPFGLLATLTISTGLLFKISAAPFHNWAPDTYEGAPTPVVGYLSVASKIAAFAVLIRLLNGPLWQTRTLWQGFLILIAVLSLTVGSIAALTQERLKRFFAYSGIAHAGYILLGIIAGSARGMQGVYVYLLVYALMNLGAFAVLTSLRSQGFAGESLRDLRGLSRRHPVHAALFAVLLLSLSGIPPTAGFIAKYFIFAALLETGHVALAVIAAGYAVVSLYLYFRLVREMYLLPSDSAGPVSASFGVRLALAGTAALTLFIGLFPEPALRGAFLLLDRTR